MIIILNIGYPLLDFAVNYIQMVHYDSWLRILDDG